ncbi:hypothetical protein ACIQYL_20195 [Lysinibacillus xylanilyticus]|uniref:hypothetical protein n=1 Tax=Lysinibacillus xylanilyticus TaxID=582475 RepID=UPI00382ED4EE
MMNFLIGLVVGLVVMLFFYLKAIKTRTKSAKQELHIPRWAMPSELYGNTFNPANTTTFTGDETPAVPTVHIGINQFDEQIVEDEPQTFVSKGIEVNRITEHGSEIISVEDVIEMLEPPFPTDKDVPPILIDEYVPEEFMTVQTAELTYEAVVLDERMTNMNTNTVYQEAKLDSAVETFAKMFKFEQDEPQNRTQLDKYEDNIERESIHDDEREYLSALEKRTCSLKADSKQEPESVTPNVVDNNEFLNAVHTNLISALKVEAAPAKKPEFEPIVLSVDDWFSGSQDPYIEISNVYEDMYTHKIIEEAMGMQTWVVRIIGTEDNFIHVSDGSARVWLDVSEYPNKLKELGSTVMLDVVSSNEKIEVASFSLLEGTQHEVMKEEMYQTEVVEIDYREKIFNEYRLEEHELYTKLA